MADLQRLIDNVSLLVQACGDDLAKGNHAAYEDYIDEFNDLLGDARRLDYAEPVRVVEKVGQSHKSAFMTGYTDTEKARHRLTLQSAKKLLAGLQHLQETSAGLAGLGSHSVTPSDRVFVVHGHDQAAKDAVVGFLWQLGLQPIVLGEQPNLGRALLQKLEDYSDVGFAVVILTPDDVGGVNDEDRNELFDRARQNVVLELGFFLGKLGRSRVCALRKGEIEDPSDYRGVGYVEMDGRGAWKRDLVRELLQAQMPFDPAKAF